MPRCSRSPLATLSSPNSWLSARRGGSRRWRGRRIRRRTRRGRCSIGSCGGWRCGRGGWSCLLGRSRICGCRRRSRFGGFFCYWLKSGGDGERGDRGVGLLTLVTPSRLKSNGTDGKPARARNGTRKEPRQQSTCSGRERFRRIARRERAGMSSMMP